MHHDRCAKAHADHADGLEDTDQHQAFHRGMAKEHERQAEFHKEQMGVISSLPEPEQFNVGDLHGPGKTLVAADPRMRRAMDDLSSITPPDPRDLAKRGLRTVPRDGQPTAAQIFGGADALEEAAEELDPELRKAIV